MRGLQLVPHYAGESLTSNLRCEVLLRQRGCGGGIWGAKGAILWGGKGGNIMGRKGSNITILGNISNIFSYGYSQL